MTGTVSAAFTPARLQAVLLPGEHGEQATGGLAPANGQAPAGEQAATGEQEQALAGGQTAPGEQAPTAAVAAILHESPNLLAPTGPAVLLIERAKHDKDPWSGHMAFPGGRAERSDKSSFRTAARETAEEIGLNISGISGISDISSSMHLGRLTDLQGGPRGTGMRLRVTPHVCWWQGERPSLELNHEVADVVWVPLAELANSDRFIQYRHSGYPGMSWPGIELDDQRVVWGLTLRMLEDLFSRVGLSLLPPLHASATA